MEYTAHTSGFTRVQLRKDVTSGWTAHDPSLRFGEIGLEVDSFGKPIKAKIGDAGESNWSELNYFLGDPKLADSFISVWISGNTMHFQKMTGGTADLALPILFQSFSYNALSALKASSGLTPGQYYLINDYQTIHTIQYTNAINVHGTTYEVASAWTNTLVEGIEPLLVLAVTSYAFSNDAKSPLYPNDTINIDFNNKLCEDGKTPRKGLITYRKDNIRNISFYYDWRNVKFRRWAVTGNTWDSGTTYALNAIVKHGNTIYASTVANNSGNTPDFTTANWGVDQGTLKYTNPYWCPIWTPALYYGAHSTLGNYIGVGNQGVNVHFQRMGPYQVPINRSDYKDYFTLNKFTDSTQSDAINFHQNTGWYEINIGKNGGSSVFGGINTGIYNNIVFISSHTLGNSNIKNIIMGADCNSMTIGMSTYDIKFDGLAGNNIIRGCFWQNSFEVHCYDNCFAGLRQGGSAGFDPGVDQVNAGRWFGGNLITPEGSIRTAKWSNDSGGNIVRCLLAGVQFLVGGSGGNTFTSRLDGVVFAAPSSSNKFTERVQNVTSSVDIRNKVFTTSIVNKSITFKNWTINKYFMSETDENGNLVTTEWT